MELAEKNKILQYTVTDLFIFIGYLLGSNTKGALKSNKSIL